MNEALERAFSAVGGPTKLARLLGVTPQAVDLWKKKGVVPPRRVPMVEHLTGVPGHELRPDMYPPPQPEAAE
jgi:DNA-binding transcriptional regulator YdaS (Cro superfamily)